jgi:hypothetical protein
MPQVHWKQLIGFNGVAVGIIGFLLVGAVCLGSIGFGAYRTATSSNDLGGSGQVLTVLGMYFSVPYLFVLGVFILAVFDFQVLRPGVAFWTSRSTLVAVAALFVVQQAFADVYLVLLLGPGALGILVGDLVVLGMFVTWQLCPNTCVGYVLLFAIKMGLVWGDAWRFAAEPVFGPSGFATILFICIPVIQLTLFSPSLTNEGISQAFVSRFNIATAHLLHSLDIISFFSFCFTPLTNTDISLAPPTPLRWLMLLLSLIAFGANNLGVPLLFFRQSFRSLKLALSSQLAGGAAERVTYSTTSHRNFSAVDAAAATTAGASGATDAVGYGLIGATEDGGAAGGMFPEASAPDPSTLSVPRGDGSRERGGGGDSSGGGGGGGAPDEKEQMLAFMLLMLMLCDFPFLVTRLALWSGRFQRIDVFAAKNIKAIVDVVMILTRTRGLG